jgi:phosphoribosylformylglycinamidine cyclo-ligase
VIGDIGGFGGLFAFRNDYRDPVLVSATDGVGTKLAIAQQMGIHDTVGIDLVAMCADDVACHGAEPLFFLDYIAIGKVVPKTVDLLVKGMAEGCRQAGCALIGGEVAEHPGVMAPETYDLAGFCVGAAERRKLVTGEAIAPGDVVLGMASSGLHSNGFSLVRKVLLEDMGLKLGDRPIQLETTLGEELLRPTTIYAPVMLALLKETEVKGFAHITGGGIPENLGRIMPEKLHAFLDSAAWTPPPVFDLIASIGKVSPGEMFATFNMGIGMAVVVAPGAANHALDTIRAKGHHASPIGSVIEGREQGPVRVG